MLTVNNMCNIEISHKNLRLSRFRREIKPLFVTIRTLVVNSYIQGELRVAI